MRAALLLAAGLVVFLAGCSTSKDAVAPAQDFTFVAPGGQTTILYDPPADRKKVSFSGESLLHPGSTVGVDNYPGKVVIVNIWGWWCGPCREEAPQLQAVAQQTGAAMLGIDVRDSRDKATDFVRDRGLTYDSIFDNPGRVLAQLHGFPRNAVPSTLVLDAQHRVAAVFLGVVRPTEIAPVVQRVQAEPAG